MSTLLFSLDLEDVRTWVKDGSKYADRVQANTEKYLEFLRKHRAKGTFFCVGELAKRKPEIIKMILDENHEIACHSNRHIQLDKLDKNSFREDLLLNIEALNKAGAIEIKGFRAPTFSLTKNTEWAYEVLQDLGFEYSSSVLPAKNPLYGWPEFGSAFKKIGKILEMPITLHSYPFLKVPAAGGVYFRVLPFPFIQNTIRKNFSKNKAVLTYFHPYDIDTEQERFMHPDLNNNIALNSLMYMNRSKVLNRLDKIILENKASLCTYLECSRKPLDH